MLSRRIIPIGIAVATLLIGGVGAVLAAGPIVQTKGATGQGVVAQATATASNAAKQAKAAGKVDPANDAIIQQCTQQVAPDLPNAPKDRAGVDQLTPEQQAKLRTEKQALGDCVKQATSAALTPEQRAQQQAHDGKLQQCIQQVAPDLANATKEAGQLTPEQMQQRVTEKINVGVCMGDITPEQAAQAVAKAVADQERVTQCEQQVAPELEKARAGSLTEAQQIDLKQRIGACVNAK